MLQNNLVSAKIIDDSIEFNVKTGHVKATGSIAKTWGLAFIGMTCFAWGGITKNSTSRTMFYVGGVIFLIAAMHNGLKIS